MLKDPISPLKVSEDVEVIKQFSAEDICERYRTNLRVDVSKYFRDVDAIQLCRGRQSGLEFFWPTNIVAEAGFYVTIDTLPHYYGQAKWEFTEALDQLNGYRTVLDVGCGDGAFLRLLKEAGHDAHGIDISPTAVHRAREKGLNASVGSFDELPSRSLPLFDAVTAFQVLEHVSDPLRLLSNVAESIRDGGVLIIAVPDGTGPLAMLDVPLDLPPHHMTRWNLAALQFVCGQLPLQMHAFRQESLAIEHVPLLARACFRPLMEPGAWWRQWRNRLAAAFATRYWQRCHDQITLSGHALLVTYRVTRATEKF